MDTRRVLTPLAGKVLAIGVVVLLLMLPVANVKDLVSERAGMRAAAIERVADGWGAGQAVGPPILEIPVDWVLQEGDRVIRTRQMFHSLPVQGAVDATLQPEVRNVGIYTVPVYLAGIKITGHFAPQALKDLATERAGRTVQWSQARLLLPLSDVHGIREFRTARWDGTALGLEPGTYDNLSAVTAPIALDSLRQGRDASFAFELELAGSESLRILPLAQTTTARLKSSWPHPNFSSGTFLPVRRSVDSSGFDANWQVLELNRGFAQSWIDQQVPAARLHNASFGVDLYQPVDTYQRNDRAIKYAVLFIAITLMSIFLWEHVAGIRLHAMQYLLVGLALSVFYLLLLALSEHIVFGLAYLVAATALVALLGIYMAGVLQRRSAGLVAAMTLAIVYSLLYLLVLSEQYALLLGAVFVFAVLATIMIVTRQFDWHAVSDRQRARLSEG